jgi:hypothetical protein
MPSDMTNTSDNNAGHKLSAVVPFRARDLVVPKGIDAGEMLAWASAEELLTRHLELASDTKAFWKDGFLLYTLWAMSDFCGIIPHGSRTTVYPYTRTRLLSVPPRSRVADQSAGGQTPHHGIQGVQPV